MAGPSHAGGAYWHCGSRPPTAVKANERLKRRSTVKLAPSRTVFRAYLGNSKVGTGGDILAVRIPWVSARRALSAARERLEMAWSGKK